MDLYELHQDLSRDEAYQRAYAEEDLIHRVGERVYVLRKKLGLSQEDLAERLGTQQPRVALIEGGFQNLTLRRLARLCYALDCRPEELVSVDASPTLREAASCNEDEARAQEVEVVCLVTRLRDSIRAETDAGADDLTSIAVAGV